MHGDMKGGRDKILHNQSICGSKPFEIAWGQSMLLLDREYQKTRRERNKRAKRVENKMVMRRRLTVLYNAY